MAVTGGRAAPRTTKSSHTEKAENAESVSQSVGGRFLAFHGACGRLIPSDGERADWRGWVNEVAEGTEMNSINSTSLCFLFLRRLVLSTLLVIAPSVWAQLISIVGPEPTARSIFTNAAPDATLAIDFEEHHLTATNETTGFLPDFTELGFVTFHTNSNYGQEIIYAGNVGQGTNNVYFTSAANHMLTLADVTFGDGVMAVGFDLKAGGVALVPQTFFAT